MTNLTEQWKNGELEDGLYYASIETKEHYNSDWAGADEVEIIDISNGNDWEGITLTVACFSEYRLIKVLAKVPTYSEHQALIAENEKLKAELDFVYSPYPDSTQECDFVDRAMKRRDELKKFKQELAKCTEALEWILRKGYKEGDYWKIAVEWCNQAHQVLEQCKGEDDV